LHLCGNNQSYRVTPDIDVHVWEKSQEYVLHDIEDCEGDTVWSLTGPGLDLFTYSWQHVVNLLKERGVEHRYTRKTVRPRRVVESEEEESSDTRSEP
jgi:hypothetical protein